MKPGEQADQRDDRQGRRAGRKKTRATSYGPNWALPRRKAPRQDHLADEATASRKASPTAHERQADPGHEARCADGRRSAAAPPGRSPAAAQPSGAPSATRTPRGRRRPATWKRKAGSTESQRPRAEASTVSRSMPLAARRLGDHRLASGRLPTGSNRRQTAAGLSDPGAGPTVTAGAVAEDDGEQIAHGRTIGREPSPSTELILWVWFGPCGDAVAAHSVAEVLSRAVLALDRQGTAR